MARWHLTVRDHERRGMRCHWMDDPSVAHLHNVEYTGCDRKGAEHSPEPWNLVEGKMICWARLLFIGLVIGSAHPSLALRSPREQAQEGSSGSRPSQPSNPAVIDGEVVGPKVPAKPGEICI